MCYAQMGGMMVATLITLLLMPVIYSILVLDLKLIKRDKREGQTTEESAEPQAAVAD